MRHHDLCPLLQWKPLRLSSQAPLASDPATGTQRAGMAPKSAPKKNREPSIFTEASKDAKPSRESLTV
jgi:hypothetical protein